MDNFHSNTAAKVDEEICEQHEVFKPLEGTRPCTPFTLRDQVDRGGISSPYPGWRVKGVTSIGDSSYPKCVGVEELQVFH